MARIEISLPARQLSRWLWRGLLALWLGNALALTLVHIGGIEDGWGVVTLLHFDREQNLPTLFSVLLLLGASALALRHACTENAPAFVRRGWQVVALVLAAMAIDEFAMIHERVDAALRYYLAVEGLPYAAWPIPYVTGVLVLGVTLWRWFWRLAPAMAITLVIAATIYVTGAAGVELATGQYLARLDPDHLGVTDLTRDLMATLEESLEMTALVLLVRAFTRHLPRAADARLAGMHP
ncbi:hypothetical protein [Maricaulis sp.]|uniref:hypothetical protein n=1 Tax=Maricaulis sp. TaxID=1486257 RepID=UPI002616FCF9|nr:hypothetical protein [Maricaulis sp.]